MKFFHLSDLHIGLKLMNRDFSADHEYVLNQVVEYAAREVPDAVVIAGDIYDRAVPSAEAVEIFDRFIVKLRAAVPDAEIMAISGNHDSAPRVDYFRNVLSRVKLRMVGQPPRTSDEFIEKISLTDGWGPVNFYLLPFVKPSMLRGVLDVGENAPSYDEALSSLLAREKIARNERNVLVSHQFYLPAGKRPDEIERMDSEIRTVGDVDSVSARVLEIFDYAALGHIHKPMEVGGERFRYCGTPLASSVSEAGQAKGVIMVEMAEKGNVKTSVLPLTPLRQVRVLRGTLDEVLASRCDDYVKVVLTEQVESQIPEILERLRFAFPFLLEVQREVRRMPQMRSRDIKKGADPFELCCEFLKDVDDAEVEILRDVINSVREGEK